MIHKIAIIYGVSLFIAPVHTLYITGKCLSQASRITYNKVKVVKRNYL
jgi:hypothetical protein